MLLYIYTVTAYAMTILVLKRAGIQPFILHVNETCSIR